MNPHWAWGMLLVVPGPVAAQADCFPPANSNEAKTLAIFSVPLAFSPLAAPEIVTTIRVQLGIEGSYVPKVSDSTAVPKLCRPGKGPENTNLLFAVPRPRLTVRVPGGFAVEASWVPPARVHGVKANLFSLAASYATKLGSGGSRLAVRAHGTFGKILAPITCDEAALLDPASECHNGTLSEDEYHPNIIGADVSFGWSMAGGRLLPYLGGGYNRLQPRFQVHFTNSQGSTDNRRVEVDLDRGVVFAGATWKLANRFGVSAEVYAAPSDAVTGRVALRVGW